MATREVGRTTLVSLELSSKTQKRSRKRNKKKVISALPYYCSLSFMYRTVMYNTEEGILKYQQYTNTLIYIQNRGQGAYHGTHMGQER